MKKLFAVAITMLMVFGSVLPVRRPQAASSQALLTTHAIYKNSAFGYSILYPTEFLLHASKGEESRYVEITNYDERGIAIEQIGNPFWPGRIKVEVFAMPIKPGSASPLRDWVEQRPETNHDDELMDEVINDITVNNVPSINLIKRYRDHTLEVRYVPQLDFVLIVSGISTSTGSDLTTILDSLAVNSVPPSEENVRAASRFGPADSELKPSSTPSLAFPNSSIASEQGHFSVPQNPDWTCLNAYQEGTAPAGFKIPITGHKIISCGTDCYKHKNSSYHAIDYVPEKSEDAPWWVIAVENGTIVETGYDPVGFGYWIILGHGQSGDYSTYAHLDPEWLFVGPNLPVLQGEELAKAGNSGLGVGHHLHFEVKNVWVKNNPYYGDQSNSVEIDGLPGNLWCPNPAPLLLGYADGQYQCPSILSQSAGVFGDSCQPVPLPTPTPTLNVDGAAYVADVTYPDGTVVSPGQAIVKTWRLRNVGTTTWGSGYKLKFVRGDKMGAPDEVSVPTTGPNGTADISVNMTAPTTPGTYKGYWQLWSPILNGVFGPEIWVQIQVPDNSQPPQTGDVILTCPGCPGVVAPGQSFRPTIQAKIINGALLQSRGDMLRHTSEPYYTDFPHIGVVGNHYAGETYNFQFYADHPIVAPTAEGTYESKWRVWRNGNWAGDELTIRFDVRNGGGTRPNPPTLVSPSNWQKYMDGSTPPLCASAPSGLQYYFQLYQSQSDHDSGWVSSNCWTPPTLPWGKYKWHVKVKDPGNNVESDWSEAWYFDLVSQDINVHGPYFDPGSPSSNDRIRAWFCIEDTGGVELWANTATNCSTSGEWQWIAHPVPPLCSLSENDHNQWPEWDTLMQPDGDHLIRAKAWHGSPGQSDYKEQITENICYTLGHRRPSWIKPINPVQDTWVNTRTITFRWNPEETARINQIKFWVSANADPTVTPIEQQTFGPSAREYTFTFGQDYASLNWRAQACNELGCGPTGDGRFGIDRVAPSSLVNTLPITIYDTIQNVIWSCTDNASGCQRYDVQVRDDVLGQWQDWRSGVTEVSGLFRGLSGHRYCFRARALDNAANLEDWPASLNGDTCTLIDLDNQPQTWWNANYSLKRKLTVLNWDGHTLNSGFPVRAHFDGTTTPTAAEIYNGSTATTKGDDVRVIYQDTTEVSRFIQTFTSSAIDIWFDLQADVGPNPGSSADYQLYYGNPSASNPLANPGDVFMPRRGSGDIASWYLSEWGGNTAADNSGNGHTATRVNGGQWVTTVRGPAIDLVKDSKQYLTVNDPAGLTLSSFTIEAWFWRDHSDVGALVSKWRDGDSDSSYLFGIWQGKMMLRLRSPSGQFFETPEGEQSNINFQDNTGYHVAATYDGSTVRFYVNGELKYTKDWTGGVRTSSKNVYLAASQGYDGDGSEKLGAYFDGLLGGIRISNYARTSFPYASFALVTNAPEVGAGAEVAYESPTIQPDLAVLSLTTYPASVNQGGGLIAQAIVKNQGTRATRNGAWTMAYADHTPTVGDLSGISFWLGTPIQAGAIATLTTYITRTSAISMRLASTDQALAESNHTLYVQADATGVTKDSNRANNISTGAQVCLANADAYEPNDAITSAVTLAVGTVVPLNFHGTEDQDWFRFTARGGVTYTLQTSNLGTAADTYLYLYGTDGVTLLASNDDYDGSLASRLDWAAPITGTYYVMARGWNPNVGGCGTGYSLSVGYVNHIYLPVVRRS